mmetsp:Transcript_39332/g.108472  ORF Transcript_39332/g.108472 Transcript_39332/m.108472 type:complete len:283 (+) Transcript_39332:2-850(+)
MDLLREYDFDALPLIDREYDDPHIRNEVNKLITDEMRNFQPPDYLTYLPYPTLEFKSSKLLLNEMNRLQSGGESSEGKIDGKRYMVDPPEDALANDPQAWRTAVSNAKAQISHQANRVMNAEVAMEYAAPQWLQHNSALQQLKDSYQAKTDAVQGEIRSINRARQLMQEQAYPEIQKLKMKANSSLQNKFLCQQSYHQLAGNIVQHSKARGDKSIKVGDISVGELGSIDAVAAAIEKVKEQRSTIIDEHDAAHNSTVRAYEAVNVSEGDTEARVSKKPRIKE